MSGELTSIFKAFADGTRRQILDMLRHGEQSAGAIAKKFEMSKPAISHHLAALKRAGLVKDKRRGQRIMYALREDSILAIWDNCLGKLCSQVRGKRSKNLREDSKEGG